MSLSREEAAMLTYRTLTQTSRRLRRWVTASLKEHGLTRAQFSLLTSIPPEGIPLTQLASVSRADPGNVSGTVDRLESAGLVERQRSQDDRRVVLICLSAKGQELVDRLLPMHREAVNQAFSRLSLDEMETLRNLLALIEPQLEID